MQDSTDGRNTGNIRNINGLEMQMYEALKKKYEKGYVTKDTLKGWVKIEMKLKGRGITAEQYEEITGEAYSE